MPVTGSDLQLFKSANTPQDETSLCGGAISSTKIAGTTVGEVFTSSITQANSFGGADRIHYEKIFSKNANATSAINSVVVYVDNILNDIASAGVATIVSSSAADTNSFQVVLIGFDSSGNPQTETLPCNGLTSVQGIIDWSVISRALFEAVSNSGLVAATGNISISVGGNVLGIIPGGDYSATGEIQIGLASAVNDSGTTTNTITAPSGVAFSKPNTYNAALAIPGGTLNAGDGIGIWVKLTVKAGVPIDPDVQVSVDTVGIPA